MSSCDSFLLNVANTKAGLSAPETPLLAAASARRFDDASRAVRQLAMRAATRWRYASSARASTASSTCCNTTAQSPWMRMSVANPHIGNSDFKGSMSIWIHLIAPARFAYCGMKGTSESSNRPRSAVSSKGRKAKGGLGDIEIDRIEFGDADAAGLRQPVQYGNGAGLAAEIGGQRN